MVITDLNALAVKELAIVCEAEKMGVIIEGGKITAAVSEEE
ncbi:unknown [Firmicutes bacterium CAG:882]|jgi:hypothetical protein|nr:unknown [Firmicutes bacterium CAG:882]